MTLIDHFLKQSFFTGLVVFGACNVEAAPCKLSTPPTINVIIQRDEVHEVDDTKVDDLDRLAMAAGEHEHLPARGAYTAVLGYNIDIDSKVEKTSDDLFCAVPTALRVYVFLTKRVIYLAHEAQTNICFNAEREHEWLHARSDAEALEKRASGDFEQLKTAITQMLVDRTNSERAAKSVMATAVRAKMDEQLDSIEQLRKSLDSEIDSLPALTELRAACSAQVPQRL